MNNLYTTHASEFNDTRQSAWNGWTKIIHFYGSNAHNILDLGSGNGRYLQFLLDNQMMIDNYIGIDNSDILLNIAKKRFGNSNKYKFLKYDLVNDLWLPNIPNINYDLLVAFGFTHHLESASSREYFFKCISELSSHNTKIILTFWQFQNISSLMKSSIEISENLFELSFGNNGAKRICYRWNDDEIYNFFEKYNLKIVDKFYSDGKGDLLNLYFMLSKK